MLRTTTFEREEKYNKRYSKMETQVEYDVIMEIFEAQHWNSEDPTKQDLTAKVIIRYVHFFWPNNEGVLRPWLKIHLGKLPHLFSLSL